VILDTKGNIFGGFTPVKWESPERWNCKTDNSLKSFLFTLKNPHNIPARRFALKVNERGAAIYCDSECGPSFGGDGSDIRVSNDCNANTDSWAYFYRYDNDTGLDRYIVFTGSYHFQVKEIEVFEITA
jgi:hypothetical protein